MRVESSPVMKRNITSADDDPDDFQDDEDLGSSCTGYGTDRKRRRGIIEKRRRDRINFNLSELRRLVPDAAQKQPSSKLEKAEILQMTVEFLHRIHRDGNVLSAETRLLENRLLGFQECFAEVTRFLAAVPVIGEVDELLRRKLLGHLHACIYRRDFEARSRLASLSAIAGAGDPRVRCREPRQPTAPTPTHGAEFAYAQTHPVNEYAQCVAGPNTFAYPASQDRADPCIVATTTTTTSWGSSQKLDKSADDLLNKPPKTAYDHVPRMSERGSQNQSFVHQQQQFFASAWPSHTPSAQLSCASTLPQNESQSTTSPSLQGNFEELESGSTSASSTGNRCSPADQSDELPLTPGSFPPSALRHTSSQQLTHQSHSSSSSSSHTQYNFCQSHDLAAVYNCCPTGGREPMTGGFSCTDGNQFAYASDADPSYTDIRTESGPPQQQQCPGYSSVELQPVAPDFLRQAATASQVYRQETGKSDNFAYY